MHNLQRSNVHRWYGVLFRAYSLDVLHKKHLRLLDDHLLSVLLVSTVYSFVPHIALLRQRQNGDGLSITSVMFNLIIATEQLAFGVHLILFSPAFRSDFQLYYSGRLPLDSKDPRRPMTESEWLDVGQFLAVWICRSVMCVCTRLRTRFGFY